jgi:hypothetical protein
MQWLPMMNALADLVAYVDRVLSPGYDVSAAQKHIGKIKEWIGHNAYVEDADPDLVDSCIETVGGVFCGVQSYIEKPLVAAWSDLEGAFGKSEEVMAEVDNFSGRTTFRFQHTSPTGIPGTIYLTAIRGEDPAHIDYAIVRPTPPP